MYFSLLLSLNEFEIKTQKLSYFSVTDKQEGEVRPLYLDAQATTPLDPRVLDAMLPYSISQYGNPHSRTHAYGWEAEEAVEVAREVGYVPFWYIRYINHRRN